MVNKDLDATSDTTDIAEELYGAYVRQAGGVTYDGKTLPTWFELGPNRQMCWIAATVRARQIFTGA